MFEDKIKNFVNYFILTILKEFRDIESAGANVKRIWQTDGLKENEVPVGSSLENAYGNMKRRSREDDIYPIKYEYFEGSSNITKHRCKFSDLMRVFD